jgi:tripartite-type tricarboxylate transporter receptor subunit TctC
MFIGDFYTKNFYTKNLTVPVGLDIVARMTRSFWGPPGLPRDIANTFSAAVKRATQDPKFIKQANDFFINARVSKSPRNDG